MSFKGPKSRTHELVPPDGGWGYMIGLGVILNLTVLTAFSNCFGMLFKELFIEIDMDSTSITIFTGVCSSCVAISGLFAGPLMKCMSMRKLGLLGAIVFNIGIFSMVFVKSKFLFFLTQGVFQNLGNGIIFNLSFTALNNYFVKKRLLAFSFTQTIAGEFVLMYYLIGLVFTSALSNLISPQFVKWSLETYGYQGTLLFISATSMHCIMGMVLMHPVEWHMKKVVLLAESGRENDDMKLPLMENNLDKNNENFSSLTKLELLEVTKNSEEHKSEFTNLKPTNHKHGIKFLLSQIIDFSLIKSFIRSNVCIGPPLSITMDLTFLMLLPLALFSMGWNENEVARALSVNALGDLVARIIFIFMSNLIGKFGSHETYVLGLVVAFVTRIGMLCSTNKIIILFFITLMGMSRCSVLMFAPVVVADFVGQDKYTSAMGLMLVSFGLTSWMIGPVIGIIRDMTDSYSIAFSVLTACFGVIIVSWSFEIYTKKRCKKMQNTDAPLNS